MDSNSPLVSLSKTKKEENRRRRKKNLYLHFSFAYSWLKPTQRDQVILIIHNKRKKVKKGSQMLKGSAVGLLRVRVGESGYILVRTEDTTHNILL